MLKSDVRGAPVQGVILIGIEGKGTERIVSTLRGMPEVQRIHTTNGRWDLIVELGAETLADLDAVLRRIRLIDGVATSETNLYLSTRQGELRKSTADGRSIRRRAALASAPDRHARRRPPVRPPSISSRTAAPAPRAPDRRWWRAAS